mmetsp:Transcript_67084/g.216831  ORF Transcript_67084/g.216831 Transcript_67084/m.216831 type:complete len:640 (-) Transcript_67084:242-2161(-)
MPYQAQQEELSRNIVDLGALSEGDGRHEDGVVLDLDVWPLRSGGAHEPSQLAGEVFGLSEGAAAIISETSSCAKVLGTLDTESREVIYSGRARVIEDPESFSIPVTEMSPMRRLNSRTCRFGLSEKASKLLTFMGSEDLLRATPLADVLRYQGRIFASSAGSASTYKLSRQVQRIRAFISHNWSSGRYPKFVCLAFHFNMNAASVMIFLMMLPMGLASYAGVLLDLSLDAFPYPVGFCCQLMCAPLFAFLLLFGRDVALLMGLRGPNVFLDKTCIHQEDASLMIKGIEKLGAFLFHSDQMVILYTDVYLQKLWTVYEVASWLVLRGTKGMIVLTLVRALALLTYIVVLYLAAVSSFVIEFHTGFRSTYAIAVNVMDFVGMIVFRRLNREKSVMSARLANFSVNQCVCFKESDRPVVYGNIVALMKEVDGSLDDANDEATLAAFDALVRQDLSGLVTLSLGSFAFGWRHAAVIAAVIWFPYLLDLLAGLKYGMPWRFWWSRAMNVLVWDLGLYPLFIAFMEVLASRFLHFRGLQEAAWLLSAHLLWLIFALGAVFTTDSLQAAADQSNRGVLAFLVFGAAVYFANYLLFSRPRCCLRLGGAMPTTRLTSETARSERVGTDMIGEVLPSTLAQNLELPECN